MRSFFKFENNFTSPSNFGGTGFLGGFNNFGKSIRRSGIKKFKPIIIFLIFIFISIICLYFFSSKSNTANLPGTAASQGQVSSLDLIIKFVIGIVIVSALIYVTVFVLRFFYTKKEKLNVTRCGNQSGVINILESINLDSNKKLHLVSVGGKVLLLSSSENQINLITELGKEEIEKTAFEVSKDINLNTNNKNFKSIFLGFFKNNV
jgi:flagellar biogenesis protein FliO